MADLKAGTTIGTKNIYDLAFVSGTRMLFVQANAPLGWTRDTTHNDKALRVVSGVNGVSNGGSLPFTTTFVSRPISGSVGNHTLSVYETPLHNHTLYDGEHQHVMHEGQHTHRYIYGGSTLDVPGDVEELTAIRFVTGSQVPMMGTSSTQSFLSGQGIGVYYSGSNISIDPTGGGGPHNHSFSGTPLDMSVQYVDVIIATKD